jgi:hypothetical protein
MAATIRESIKQTYLGYLDAVMEKKETITALSLEELTKVATISKAACNNCCNGSAGMTAEDVLMHHK